MTKKIHRRDAIKKAAATGAGFYLGTLAASASSQSPNERLNVAMIGVGGRGGQNLHGIAPLVNLVALCDVDDQRAGDAYTSFPKAKKYYDYRRMLDEMDTQIDAVVVSTPDHTHFHPSMLAMEMGKHLYCEKPLAHTVWEVRQMTELARKKGAATQLGSQRHTFDIMHRVVETIQSGGIGEVKEVHSWIDSDRGMPAVPTEFPPVPSGLKWDLWLGPGAKRPYSTAYCPYSWRFFWDYGTGETGNWGCHILDIPYWALDLKYPTRVDASGPEVHQETTPTAITTKMEFPARGNSPAVTLNWYQAAGGPPILRELNLVEQARSSPQGANTLFLGSDGMLLCGFDMWMLLPEETFADFKTPEKSIPDSPGFYMEWIRACQGGKPATCQFDYSGPLTETVLLGNAAYRGGGGFDWDAAALKASGNSKAAEFIQPEFHNDWS